MKKQILILALISILGQLVSFYTLVTTNSHEIINLSSIVFIVSSFLGLLTILAENKFGNVK